MRLFPKKLTDDEFVEQQRKNMRISKWMDRIFISLFICIIIIYYMIVPKFVILLYEISSGLHTNSLSYYEIGFFCGIIWGIIFGFIFVKGVIFLQRHFWNRADKLIIKYIKKAEKLNIRDEKDIAYSQWLNKVIEKSRSIIGWLWIVGIILLFLFTFESLYKVMVEYKLIALGIIIEGSAMGFILAEKILVIIMPLFIFPMTRKKELLLIKYYDIVKAKKESVLSENEFKNGSDKQLTDN